MIIDEIKNDESNIIEYKESLPDNSNKYLKTLVAFANSCGGKLVIGIEDKTLNVIGIPKNEVSSIMDTLSNVIDDSITPQIIPNFYVEEISGKPLLIVEIFHGSSTPYYIKSLGDVDGTFIRVGGTTRVADAAMLKELKLAGNNKSYDELVYDRNSLTIDEINKFCNYLTSFAKDNTNNENIKDVNLNKLLAWKVIQKIENNYYPTNAYMMLSENNPFQFVKIQCARFKGIDRSVFIDKKDYEGPIYKQINDAYKFVLNHINIGLEIVGLTNKENYELPPKALREIITNAVCHRQLNANSCVQVAVYDNKVEITSPGTLFGGLTIAGMKNGTSSIRNSAIANVFHYLGLIENWGSGVARAIEQCKEMGLKDLEIIEMSNCLRINFYRPSYVSSIETKPNIATITNLTEQETIIINYIKQYGSIRRVTVEDILNVKDSRANEILKSLLDKKLLKQEGKARALKYTLV